MGPRPFRVPLRRKAGKAPPEYLRFVCFQQVEGRKHRLGLFQALELAEQSDLAEPWALTVIRDLYAWFKAHLAVPPDRIWDLPVHEHPLCWFKPSAEEHIRHMHDLKAALEHCGVHVEVIKTRTPGLIRFEDEHQIAATPRALRF